MLERKDLAVGKLVWWPRLVAGIDDGHPCVITWVGKESIRITSLYNLSELSNLVIDEVLSEWERCSFLRALEYVRGRKKELKIELKDLERKTKESREFRQRYKLGLEEILSTLGE